MLLPFSVGRDGERSGLSVLPNSRLAGTYERSPDRHRLRSIVASLEPPLIRADCQDSVRVGNVPMISIAQRHGSESLQENACPRRHRNANIH